MQEFKKGTLRFRQLGYFLTLAEYGSISAAANALNMAQPSLSENIAKLERQLEVQLAIRGTRGIQLTEAGTKLVERGTEIMKAVDDLVTELRALSEEPRGPVAVGFPPSLSILLSVPLLETIHSEHKDVRLHVAEAMSGDILDWLANDRIDFGCVYEISDSSPYSFEPLLTEELFLVTAPDNWDDEFGPDMVAKNPIKASQLQELPLVLTSPTHGARKLQEKFARAGGFNLNVVAAIDSLPHIVEMVGRASAYSILSHGAVIQQVDKGKIGLVRIVEPTIQRTAYMVRKRSRPVSRASAIVEATIFTILGEMVERYGIQATQPDRK
ncbi:LysR family transcriptional regulator [Antarctobacter sp.]|uniref:LysR family transcriptional regulator n=1 Tax=Antarctobacter sp. TaxID=1872577 RepID=UPI003A8E85CA